MSSADQRGRDEADEQLIRRFLQETSDLSQEEAAELVPGVSQSDVSRWRRDEWRWITAKKRRALRSFLGGGTNRIEEPLSRYERSSSPRRGDPDGSPAERLMYWLTHEELRRRFADHDAMDFVKAAFAIALEEDFGQEELEKLSRWREEVRSRAEGDASPTDG